MKNKLLIAGRTSYFQDNLKSPAQLSYDWGRAESFNHNPAMRGSIMLGSRMPIAGEDVIRLSKPGIIVILPWNIKREVTGQLNYIKNWGGEGTAVPALEVV